MRQSLPLLALFQILSFSALTQTLAIKPEWLKEVDIAGTRVQQLRVPTPEITDPAGQDILMMQQELTYAYEHYQLGEHVSTIEVQTNAKTVMQRHPGWPVEYYVKEREAYEAYNKNRLEAQRRYNDSLNKDQEERFRLQDLTRGYCFISKPIVILKTGVIDDYRVMGKIYFGSYIKVESTDELGNAWITIEGEGGINNISGQIKIADYVDDIRRLKGTPEEMAIVKSRRYYKFEEDAAYATYAKKQREEARQEALAAAAARRSSRSRSAQSRTYITGPRGGCYYINSNGNKVYVDHSFCQ